MRLLQAYVLFMVFLMAQMSSLRAADVMMKHSPFANQQCLACHKKGADGKPVSDAFVADQPTLCYQCHERKDKRSIVHPALTMGDCTTCHAPHESPNKALLKDKIENTCTMCHDAPGQDLPVKHFALNMTKSCVRCHNPHSSDNEKLLKAETPQLCIYCHDKIKAGLDNPVNVIHPAVYMGCQSCHSPHGSENQKLLKSLPNDLCFSCHAQAKFSGGHPRAGHPISDRPDPLYPSKTLSCISCHKPHYSPNERMLRYNINKAPYDGTICSVCHWKQLLPPPGPPQPKWDD